MCGWIGNGILARAPIRPNSAWKALRVIGPSRSVMKTCEDAPPRRCLSARLAQRCGSPNPLRTAPGSETARATTSRTDLCVASSTREARQSAINWSRSNIILIRQCVWIAQFVRGAAAKSSGALPTPPVLLPNDSTYETAALRDCSPVNVRFGSCVTSIAGPNGHAQLYERWRRALRGRQTGVDLKPPQAAVVKSNGGERCGNAGTRFRQARLREASASEPSMKCRKRIRRCQNRGLTLPPGSARGNPEDCPSGIRHVDGAKLNQALVRNVRTCRSDAKGEVSSGQNREDKSTDAEHRDGAARIRDKGSVMELDRRGCVAQPRPRAN